VSSRNLEPLIGSAALFRYELEHLVRAYLRHFEPAAQVELATVRLEATGPDLSVTFEQHAEQPASVQVNLNAVQVGLGERRS
jgi:hypothetical protein